MPAPFRAGAWRSAANWPPCAGRSIEAEKWLREAVALEPGDYQAHYQLAQCLEKNGKPDDAQTEQDRLEEIKDDMNRSQTIAAGQTGSRAAQCRTALPDGHDLAWRGGRQRSTALAEQRPQGESATTRAPTRL